MPWGAVYRGGLPAGENAAGAFSDDGEAHEEAEELLGEDDPAAGYKDKMDSSATMPLQGMDGAAYHDAAMRPMPRGYEMNFPPENAQGMGNRMSFQKRYRQPKERGGVNRQPRGGNRQGHEGGAYGEMGEPKPRRNPKQQGMQDGGYRNYQQKGYPPQRQVQGKYNNRIKGGAEGYPEPNRREGGNRVRGREGNTQQHDAY